MKKYAFLFLLLSGLAFSAIAQDQEARFDVSVSTDSVLLGHYFEVTFTLENASGDQFSAPDFGGLQIIGGPNTSSSVSIVNGDMSQKMTYTYYLQPSEIGSYFIGPASVETDGQILETTPIEIMVFPNPDGVEQPAIRRGQSFDFDFFDPFPRMETPPPPAPPAKPKKKRKITRI
jgi:uncharacterized protein (DUF58 family)